MTSRRRTPAAALCALLAAILSLAPAAVARADADHLVLTEVVARERQLGDDQVGSSFVEIANPTAAAVPLEDVYLTTATDAINGKRYWLLPAGGDSGGGSGGNVHARFPAGMSIAAGDTLVIATKGTTQFQAAYGFLPDLELFEDDTTPDAVPEMREVFRGSIGAGLGGTGTNVPAFSENVDSIVLYAWDGAGDLVRDLDYLFWGSDARVRVDKTGAAVDGPDPDAAPAAYAADTAPALQHPALSQAPTFGRSLQRRSWAEEDEAATGGNGATGHDETSEDLAASWRLATAQEPAAPPAAWFRTAPIVTQAAHVPAAPVVGAPVAFTARVLSYDDLAAVTFFYTIDGDAPQSLAGAAAGGDDWTAQLAGLAAGDTVAWWVEAATAAGATVTHPFGGQASATTFVVAEPPTPGDGPAKLLFTEVCLTPSPGEFVEIHNPNPFAVGLADYYLTDAIYAPDNQFYWRIVEGDPQASTIGGGAFNDFHARLPERTIAAGDTVTVALLGSEAFAGYHGVRPDFELFEDAAVDSIPNLREVFPGSIGTPDAQFGVLTNYNLDSGNGEVLVLYYWDGASDLVTDVDVLVWGNGTSYRFSKAGVSIDGPDADALPSTYASETAANEIAYLQFGHSVSESYTRIDGSEGAQAGGGNGVDGRDELSENWAATFAAALASPAVPQQGGGGGEGEAGPAIALEVPARTFLPRHGEVFPISFVSRRNWQTRLRILDLQGRLVISLFDSAFDGNPDDPETLAWDGRDETYDQVRAGLYVVHLSVVDPASGDETVKTAPVVVATRLQK